MAISNESLNYLKAKVNFYAEYRSLIPLHRNLDHYSMIWMLLNRFVIRASSGGDIYSLLAECFPRTTTFGKKAFNDLDSLLANIKASSNKTIYGATRHDPDLTGYEEIFSNYWGDDEQHPSPEFLRVWTEFYLPVETQFFSFVDSILFEISSIQNKRREKVHA